MVTGVKDEGTTKNVVGIVGSSESKGFELEFILTPISNAVFSFGYGYTDATIRDINKNEYLDVDPQKGMRLAGIPKNRLQQVIIRSPKDRSKT